MQRWGRTMKSIKAIVGPRETVTVNRFTSVREAARMMSERQIGGVPVVDAERLVGTLTERDVMARVVEVGLGVSSQLCIRRTMPFESLRALTRWRPSGRRRTLRAPGYARADR